nr:odorant receptor 22c-like [Onthophagus taurus]
MYYQEIFRMCQFTNSFCTSFLIPAKVFITICLSLAITEFVLRKDLATFFLILMNIQSLFINHTTGQRLTTATANVADAVYNLNWYDADVSTRKDVLILLGMSQKAIKVELPFFREFSHAAAANECKKVYIFFNWILTVLKKRNF